MKSVPYMCDLIQLAGARTTVHEPGRSFLLHEILARQTPDSALPAHPPMQEGTKPKVTATLRSHHTAECSLSLDHS